MDSIQLFTRSSSDIDVEEWELGRYRPTPSIVEAAVALYNGHSVEDISRNDAKDKLALTAGAIEEVISSAQAHGHKSICFVTGVPGAGKTLIGLNTATIHREKRDALHSVFLSGNGPLVAILREALARNHLQNEKEKGNRIKKGEARSKVKKFIQPVHEFRDECIQDLGPPIEHVVLFDEAQRAWNLAKTSAFLKRRKGITNFRQSEPEFLISCLDRHRDWAVIICLVGGGQEIHTGEVGISEWIRTLEASFPKWHIYISPQLSDSEYGAGQVLDDISSRANVVRKEELHLSVSMRSFRAENVSRLVKELLDLELENARSTLSELSENYPIVITRDIVKAKNWVRTKARGSERYGLVVSSQAERLKP